jgi:dsDNA-specific endonuclease/ATPase MutS2
VIESLDLKTKTVLEISALLQIIAEFADTELGKNAVEALAPLPDKESAIREHQRVSLFREFLSEESSLDFYWLREIEPWFLPTKTITP